MTRARLKNTKQLKWRGGLVVVSCHAAPETMLTHYSEMLRVQLARERTAALLRVRPHIPTTAGTAALLADFLCAVTVDPVVVWAPRKNSTAVSAWEAALGATPFRIVAIRSALGIDDVMEVRLLHGAWVVLYNSLRSSRSPGPGVRDVLLNLFVALYCTGLRYDAYIEDDARANLRVDSKR